MEEKLNELKMRLMEIDDLNHANSVLGWDQATYMPAGGAAARGRQMATLGRLAQEKFVDPAIGRLLDELEPVTVGLPFDSDDASLIRVTRRDYEQATKIPPQFLAEYYQHTAISYQVWTEARPANDFQRVLPYLEKNLEYSRKIANFFPGYEHIADPLIDMADYGMKASSVRVLFAELRKELAPIVRALTSQAPADNSCLLQSFPEDAQLAFGKQVIELLGYDFRRGRQDKTHHPFMTKFSLGDVRITTRVKERDLTEALFSTIHESGHAMYEQGIRMALDGSPLAGGTSAGVHESQSRLWENILGRSREFWEYFYPLLQEQFPQQLGQVSLDTFYRAINKVEKSLIRTDADEVTYNLHVMLRFELELQMLEGTLAVRDLPEAWNAGFKEDLGLTPPNHANGVMQDVHWYGGGIGGAFQGYTLGNILSAQFYAEAMKAHPEIPAEIRQGRFDILRDWLTKNIYQHGRKFTAPELVQRVTGEPLRIEPYIAYLRRKYSDLYPL